MATVATTPLLVQGEQRIVIRGVAWQGYQSLLRMVGGQPVRLTYDRGDVELMSPLPTHERKKSCLGRAVRILTEELLMPVMPMGSTTWSREDLDKGIEADESFYLGDLDRVRNPDKIDLEVDPAPDLAIEIEIEITRRRLRRPGIYGVLGVPEIWRFNGREFKLLLRQDDGSYRQSLLSAAFPDVPMAEIERIATMEGFRDENEWARQFREWVRTEVLPRHSA